MNSGGGLDAEADLGCFAIPATVTAVDSTIAGHRAGENGGGLASDHAAFTLTDSTISGHVAEGGAGGGIAGGFGGDVVLVGSALFGNRSAESGGGLSTSSASLTNSTVGGNPATGEDAAGGGVFADIGLPLTNTTVRRNSTLGAGVEGGGLASDAVITLENTIVTGMRR